MKYLAYNFLESSGLLKTAEKTGHTEATVFADDPLRAVNVIVYSVLSLTGIAFLILMFYGGYLWMAAQGNDEQVGKAKKIITGAVIGLAITLASFAFATFILNAFGEEGLK